MKADKTNVTTHYKNAILIVLVTVCVLAIPLIAMQFTDEVTWSAVDFLTIGALLIGTGLMYKLLTNKLRTAKQRIILGITLIAALLLVWVELAVGLFGTPLSGQ